MVNYVQFTNSTLSITKKVAAHNITYSWQNQVADFPIAGNLSTVQPVQFNGWRNPGISIMFSLYLNTSNNPSGFMTWTDWINLSKATSTTTLKIQLTDDSTVLFTSYAKSSTGVTEIPVQISNWSTSIDPKEDFTNNTIIINAQLIETSS